MENSNKRKKGTSRRPYSKNRMMIIVIAFLVSRSARLRIQESLGGRSSEFGPLNRLAPACW